jgi:hypothetical protein
MKVQFLFFTAVFHGTMADFKGLPYKNPKASPGLMTGKALGNISFLC